MRAVTNCTLWQFSGARLATLLKHQPEFLPPLCNSYLRVRSCCSPGCSKAACNKAACNKALAVTASQSNSTPARAPAAAVQQAACGGAHPSPSTSSPNAHKTEFVSSPPCPLPPQYIHELQRRAEERGMAAPKRLGRIEREVRALMEKVSFASQAALCGM